MAQLLNFAQIKQKALLQCQCVGDDQKRSEDFVEAKDLTYTNPQGWKFGKNSVELISTRTLQVDGKDTQVDTLEMGDYEVYFELELKNNFNIMTDVEFTLTVGAKKDKNTEHLNNYPRNQSLWIKAGEFTKALGTPGTIQFGFNGTENRTAKEGMVVEGVLIIKSSDN